MTTEQTLAGIQQHGDRARRRLLTDEERETARRHAEERDYGRSSRSSTPSDEAKSDYPKQSFGFWLKWLVFGMILLMIIIVIFLFISDAHNRENVRTTAERELKSSATEINHSLPANNQLNIDSLTVSYVDYNKLVVNFYKGNARCTVPVNPPDEQHYLYWTPKVDPVPVDKLDSTLYKCVASVSPDKIGASTAP